MIGIDNIELRDFTDEYGDSLGDWEVTQNWDKGQTIVDFGDGNQIVFEGPDVRITGEITRITYDRYDDFDSNKSSVRCCEQYICTNDNDINVRMGELEADPFVGNACVE